MTDPLTQAGLKLVSTYSILVPAVLAIEEEAVRGEREWWAEHFRDAHLSSPEGMQAFREMQKRVAALGMAL